MSQDNLSSAIILRIEIGSNESNTCDLLCTCGRLAHLVKRGSYFFIIIRLLTSEAVCAVVQGFPEAVLDWEDHWQVFIAVASDFFVSATDESLSVPKSRASW